MNASTEGMQHTPGPWEFHAGEDNGTIQGEPVLGSIVYDDWHIARIWSDQPNAEADARLIAAAPDLLEALEKLEVLAEDSHAFDDLQCFMDDPETRRDFQDEYTMRVTIRNAIAKARGFA